MGQASSHHLERVLNLKASPSFWSDSQMTPIAEWSWGMVITLSTALSARHLIYSEWTLLLLMWLPFIEAWNLREAWQSTLLLHSVLLHLSLIGCGIRVFFFFFVYMQVILITVIYVSYLPFMSNYHAACNDFVYHKMCWINLIAN
jgi:hypothetical protein